MKKAYLPQWYINKYEKREEKSYKYLTLVLFVVVFIFSLITLNTLNSYNELVRESIFSQEEIETMKDKKLTLETFSNIRQNIIESELKAKSILINENIISMNIALTNENEYLNYIKYLEGYGNIIYISNIIETDNNKYFEVKVKIKNEND